jgi:hypothetical protein
MSLPIRPARPDGAGFGLSFIRELADYEKLLHEVAATRSGGTAIGWLLQRFRAKRTLVLVKKAR